MPTAARKEPEPESPDPRDARIAELESQLAEARRPRSAVGSVASSALSVRLKVEPPHAALHYAGHVIGTEYTEVPANIVAALMAGAADAGVTLTQDMEA